MYYRVPPIKGVRLVGGVWVIPNATNGLTLFSGDELHPNGPSSLSTIGAFKVATGTFTQAWGTHPQLNWGLPSNGHKWPQAPGTTSGSNKLWGIRNLE
jgi:hypothetical protein